VIFAGIGPRRRVERFVLFRLSSAKIALHNK
jgi:hypothetical protein